MPSRREAKAWDVFEVARVNAMCSVGCLPKASAPSAWNWGTAGMILIANGDAYACASSENLLRRRRNTRDLGAQALWAWVMVIGGYSWQCGTGRCLVYIRLALVKTTPKN